MKKLILFVMIIFSCFFNLKGQDSEPYRFVSGTDTRYSLFGGYNLKGREGSKRYFHSLELGFSKTTFTKIRPHPVGKGWYISSEILLDKELFITPKVGCFVHYVVLICGIETGYHTNIDEGSWVIRPYFGIGNQKVQFLVKPNIQVTNRDFTEINVASLTCYYHFLPIKKSFVPFRY